MTDLLRAVLLGLVQGLTEFLPVSSSGHLTLILHLSRWDKEKILPLVICLHLATTAAAAVYLGREIAAAARGFLPGGGEAGREARRTVWLLAAATAVTALIGFTLKDFFESLFTSTVSVAAGLAITGLALWIAAPASGAKRPADLPLGGALLVGLAQGVAIAPGISRSGATIAAGLLLGLSRPAAFVFSFLLSIPANLGAAVLEAGALGRLAAGDIIPAMIGMAAAFLSGWGALVLLSRWVREGRLRVFSAYCWFLAAALAALGV